MYARAVPAVRVECVEHLGDGVTALLVSCNDHDQFMELPAAVEFNGVYYGKTGWNSDKNKAYYRTDGAFARVAVLASTINCPHCGERLEF